MIALWENTITLKLNRADKSADYVHQQQLNKY